MTDEFDWDEEKDDIVVPRRDAIAVYTNKTGDVVVRQQNEAMGDQFVVIALDDVDAVVERIRQKAAESSQGL